MQCKNWKSIEVKDITAVPAKDGQYQCYQFEIWGFGTPSIQVDDENLEVQNSADQILKKVAKQTEL